MAVSKEERWGKRQVDQICDSNRKNAIVVRLVSGSSIELQEECKLHN